MRDFAFPRLLQRHGLRIGACCLYLSSLGAYAQNEAAPIVAGGDDGGWSAPLAMLVIVVVLAVLVVGRRRRKEVKTPVPTPRQAAVRPPSPPSPRDLSAPSAGTPAPASVPARPLDRGPKPDMQAASEQRLRAVPPPVEDDPEQPGADFYDEVARLLLDELQKSPQRRDLRFKLMEVYASSGHRDQFVEQTYLYMKGLGGQVDAYWPRIVRMGQELAPETGLYTETPASTLPAASATPPKTQMVLGRRFYDGVNPMRLSTAQEGLQSAYKQLREDLTFWKEVQQISDSHRAPPPLRLVESLSNLFGGVQIYVKDGRGRELSDAADVSAIAQVLIAKRMGKRRVVAGGSEDGHAFAVARVARQLGLDCTIYLHDAEQRAGGKGGELQQLGANLMTVRDSILGIAAETQLQTLSDALDDIEHSLYISPLSAGPAPYPTIILDLQGMAGRLLRAQMKSRIGRVADALLVSTADGMHTVGQLQPFLGSGIDLHCVEAIQDQGRSSRASFAREHSWLRASERVKYVSVSPEIAQFAARACTPADFGELHAAGGEVMAEAFRVARAMTPGQTLVVVIPTDAHPATAF